MHKWIQSAVMAYTENKDDSGKNQEQRRKKKEDAQMQQQCDKLQFAVFSWMKNIDEVNFLQIKLVCVNCAFFLIFIQEARCDT